jgi:hypothetical protein
MCLEMSKTSTMLVPLYSLYYRGIVLQWRSCGGGFFKLASEHGHLEVQHIGHPIVLIDASHHVC